MSKGFQRNDYSTNTQQAQGGNKPFNLGFKRIPDGPREPLKCLECGDPHLRRNCPRLNRSNRTSFHNLQEDTIVEDVGKNIHIIIAALEGRQVDHQSTVV